MGFGRFYEFSQICSKLPVYVYNYGKRSPYLSRDFQREILLKKVETIALEA